ncbi:tail protein X [Methylocystis sp. S23]
MGYIVETTKPGDRWDLIAYRMYGDPSRYAPIIEANRALFATAPLAPIPTVLEAGLELRIPILDDVESADDVPPWRR